MVKPIKHHLMALVAMLMVSLPALSQGFKARPADHPEVGGKCVNEEYAPGWYVNMTLTEKAGWYKKLGAAVYFKAVITFWLDEYLTEPASVNVDMDGELASSITSYWRKQTLMANSITLERTNLDDFSFLIPQQVIDKMSMKYADNDERKARIYFKVVFYNKLGARVLQPDNSYRPGSIPLKYGSTDSFSRNGAGFIVDFTGNYTEESLGFDNPDATEKIYQFAVHYWGTGRHERMSKPGFPAEYKYRLYFWQDAAMTKPFMMDFVETNPLRDGQEIPTSTFEDYNKDKWRNYLEGTRKNYDDFNILMPYTVIDGFLAQALGKWGEEAYVHIYFQFVPEIPALVSNRRNMGCILWHCKPIKLPKNTIRTDTTDVVEFGYEYNLFIAPTNIDITDGSPLDINIDVKATDAWTASSSAPWCKLGKTGGSQNDNVLPLSISANNTDELRTGIITVKLAKQPTVRFEVNVRQYGRNDEDSIPSEETDDLSVSPPRIVFQDALAHNANVRVKASDAWTATSSSPWCKLAASGGGEGDNVLPLSVSENTTQKLRKAAINVRLVNNSSVSRTVEVVQYGAEKPEEPEEANDSTILLPEIKTSCPPHEWVQRSKSRTISYRTPVRTKLTINGKTVNLRLVQDEKNDSICFYVMDFPVKQSLYEYEKEENPSAKVDADAPVTNIGEVSAESLCSMFSSEIGEKYGLKFRLPTSDEWLLAAKQLPDLNMGKEYTELLDGGQQTKTNYNEDGASYGKEVTGYHVGGHNANGNPAINTVKDEVSPTTTFRMIAERTIASARLDEVTVSTDSKDVVHKWYKLVIRHIRGLEECVKCGAIEWY